jgi:HSP20 family protein
MRTLVPAGVESPHAIGEPENITRWEPFREMEDMLRQYSPFFGRALRREGDEMAEWKPAADITETEKEYLIKAELPEVKKEDVKIELTKASSRSAANAKRKSSRRMRTKFASRVSTVRSRVALRFGQCR